MVGGSVTACSPGDPAAVKSIAALLRPRERGGPTRGPARLIPRSCIGAVKSPVGRADSPHGGSLSRRAGREKARPQTSLGQEVDWRGLLDFRYALIATGFSGAAECRECVPFADIDGHVWMMNLSATVHASRNEPTIGLIKSGRVSGAMWPPATTSL